MTELIGGLDRMFVLSGYDLMAKKKDPLFREVLINYGDRLFGRLATLHLFKDHNDCGVAAARSALK